MTGCNVFCVSGFPRAGHGLLFWPFEGSSKVSSGIVKWYRSSFRTDFDSFETNPACPAPEGPNEP